MTNQHTTPPPGASAEGVDQGQRARVLSNLMIRLRKKKLVNSTMYFSFIILVELLTPPKRWINTPSARSRPVETPLHTPLHPPSRTPIFGRLLCGKSLIGSRLRPRPCPSLYFLSFHLVAQNNGMMPPHAIQPGRTSSCCLLILAT
jgi:hypothetical protein